MAKSERRVAVDSCVIVNVLTGGGQHDDPAWLPASESVLRAAESGKFTMTVSVVTVAEVFGDGGTRGDHLSPRDRRANVQAARKWLSNGPFRIVEAERTLAEEAAQLAVEHQLKGADAIILASALRAGADALCTWDKGLLKIGASIEGLRVLTPDKLDFDRDLFSH